MVLTSNSSRFSGSIILSGRPRVCRMDVVNQLTSDSANQPIQCIDMHTTGELTRIIVSGYPILHGTLLEQRAQALQSYDNIRRRLILEPRGHADAYGALLRTNTELTATNQAHIGVLFLTNDGYSPMCGHATIALGRFLIDTWDTTIFPKRGEIGIDAGTLTAKINLHAPCGLVEITVPVTPDGKRSDPARMVSFLNVPSYTTGIDVEIDIPHAQLWPELQGRTSVKADFSYGGAFFCFVPATELGFRDGLRNVDFEAVNRAIRRLRTVVNGNEALRDLYQHPDHKDLAYVYCFILTDKSLGAPSEGACGAETGYCYFGHEQIDRSPTGSAVTARAALAYARGERQIGQKWTYHSLVSAAYDGRGGFDAVITKAHGGSDDSGKSSNYPVTTVQISGKAFYIGCSSFIVEKEDILGDGGFLFKKLDSL